MCIERKAGNCTLGSFVTLEGVEYWVDIDHELAMNEEVMLVATDGSGAINVNFEQVVTSHYVSPIERREAGTPKCERGLNTEPANSKCWLCGIANCDGHV